MRLAPQGVPLSAAQLGFRMEASSGWGGGLLYSKQAGAGICQILFSHGETQKL
jgi:hypothetical protein